MKINQETTNTQLTKSIAILKSKDMNHYSQ